MVYLRNRLSTKFKLLYKIFLRKIPYHSQNILYLSIILLFPVRLEANMLCAFMRTKFDSLQYWEAIMHLKFDSLVHHCYRFKIVFRVKKTAQIWILHIRVISRQRMRKWWVWKILLGWTLADIFLFIANLAKDMDDLLFL